MADDLAEEFRDIARATLAAFQTHEYELHDYTIGHKLDRYGIEYVNVDAHGYVRDRLAPLLSPTDLDVFTNE